MKPTRILFSLFLLTLMTHGGAWLSLIPSNGNFTAGWGPELAFADDPQPTDPTSAATTNEDLEASMHAEASAVVSRGIESAPQIPLTLERAVQFQTSEGEAVLLDEGNYLIDVSESSPLQITAEAGNESWKLMAQVGTHEETLEEAEAQSVLDDDEDQHHLVLLLPNGKTLDATGSYSGVGKRAISAAKARAIAKSRAKRAARSQRNARSVSKVLPGTAMVPLVSALKGRTQILEKGKTQFYKGLFRNRVIVKFKEGAPVRFSKSSRKSAKPSVNLPKSLLDAKTLALMKNGKLSEAKIQTDIGKFNQILKRPQLKKARGLFSRADSFLRSERNQAEKLTGKAHADLGSYMMVELAAGAKGEELVDELKALPSVEYAYLAPIPVDAQADISPTTPNLQGNQGYLGAAPQGIDAQYAWTFPGGRGQGIRVIDIERNWYLQHEDLPTAFYQNGSISTSTDHGTAVVGEMVAGNNNYGATGIANGGRFGVVSVIRPDGDYSVAEAVNVAASQLSRGDVILIEQHAKGPSSGQSCTCNCGQFEYIAMEYWQAEFDAMKAATSRGIIVVEAAGNGSMNLDAARYNNRFKRNVRDSGAIIVGASNGNLSPTCWTNRGSRVDVHGWGQGVWSTGYGQPNSNKINGNDRRQWYTNAFSGTSSASPIVAGAVMDLMGIRRAAGIEGMNPTQLRTLLRNTGTPQQNTGNGQIGPLPNLRNAISQLKLEDCVGFNPNKVSASRINKRWKVVDGKHWLLDFSGDKAAALKARDTIKHYKMNKTCYIGRPGPSMTYWLAGNQPPTGSYKGEDCTSFNPSKIEVRRTSGRWKIVEGKHWIADFGSKQNEALAALNIIKRYEFKKQCFVKRPKASMKYWRK